MMKKYLAYFLIIFGFLCFLIVGGGSFRYGRSRGFYHLSYTDGLYYIAFLIATPIIGFFSMKMGFKLLEKIEKNSTTQEID